MCILRNMLGSLHHASARSAAPAPKLSQSPYWMPIRGPVCLPIDTARRLLIEAAWCYRFPA